MSENIFTSEQKKLLAAELALGLLQGDELAEATRLRLFDTEFAKKVDEWNLRLAELYNGIDGTLPPPRLRNAVIASIENQLEAPSVETISTMPSSAISSWWKFGAMGSSSLAAALAFLLVAQPSWLMPQPTADVPIFEQQIVASLSGESAELSIVTRFEPTTGKMIVRSQGGTKDEKAVVLWVIPSDGAPRAIGEIPATGQTDFAVSPALRAFIDDGATLAVTKEDRSDAIYEVPTMPIIASGKITKI